jgi:hypothetical protein
MVAGPSGMMVSMGVDELPEAVPLAELGLDEVETGIVENTFEARQELAQNGWKFSDYWGPLPDCYLDAEGNEPDRRPMLLQVYPARNRALRSFKHKHELLVNEDDVNSDYLVGPSLLLWAATKTPDERSVVPAWVYSMTRKHIHNYTAAGREAEIYDDAGDGTGIHHWIPVRCTYVRADNTRCWLWSTHPKRSPAHCKAHSGVGRDPREIGRIVDSAKTSLIQAAPAAVVSLERLMMESESEPVRLKATTEILDRAGVRGGIEIDQNVTVEVTDPAAQVRERLERLAGRLTRVDSLEAAPPGDDQVAAPLSESAGEPEPVSPGTEDTVDAEIVSEEPAS